MEDTGIRIGSVMYKGLLGGKPVVLSHPGRITHGGKNCADQQPDKVVGSGGPLPLHFLFASKSTC